MVNVMAYNGFAGCWPVTTLPSSPMARSTLKKRKAESCIVAAVFVLRMVCDVGLHPVTWLGPTKSLLQCTTYYYYYYVVMMM